MGLGSRCRRRSVSAWPSRTGPSSLRVDGRALLAQPGHRSRAHGAPSGWQRVRQPSHDRGRRRAPAILVESALWNGDEGWRPRLSRAVLRNGCRIGEPGAARPRRVTSRSQDEPLSSPWTRRRTSAATGLAQAPAVSKPPRRGISMSRARSPAPRSAPRPAPPSRRRKGPRTQSWAFSSGKGPQNAGKRGPPARSDARGKSLQVTGNSAAASHD